MIKETTVAKQNMSMKNNYVIQLLDSINQLSVSISLSLQNEQRSEHVKRAHNETFERQKQVVPVFKNEHCQICFK